MERIIRAADVILEKCGEAEIGLILGSGLADSLDLENSTSIKYKDIPNFPLSTVSGHKSEWAFGTLYGKKVCAMRGKIHYYEGRSTQDITFPIRVMKLLGVKTLIVTGAVGGINRDFNPGELMLIKDSINFGGLNPLIGPNMDELGPRFPDMTYAYDRDLCDLARKCAEEQGITLREGVYIWFSGPSYETPAEIRAARILGADVVGMSTVPEVIVARHCGIRVLGITCITNMAAGILDKPLDHDDVLVTGAKARGDFTKLVKEIIKNM